MADAEIEDARPEDLPALQELALRAGADAWSERGWEHELADRGARIRILRSDAGSPVAFLVTRHVSGEVQVLNLGVAPELRRRGLARRLLVSAMRQAHAADDERMTLEVRDSNHAARSLYEDVGFVVVGRRPRYYRDGEDADLMTLELDP